MRFYVMAGMVCALFAATARAEEPSATTVTVLAQEQVYAIEGARLVDGQLLIPAGKVATVTGFEIKEQGLCAGEVCIPIPSDAGWMVTQGGEKYLNLTRFAEAVDQVFAVDLDKQVWSFTPVPQVQASRLLACEAPDFALRDRAGKLVRLSDFRGKKVLVLTWASWCGCRFDLAGWQKVYEELKDKNFEIVAAAQDTGGMNVAGPWYDKAKVTYTALVDPSHTVSSLYQMVNVPTGVWIDETGKIVRAPEVSYSKEQKILGQDIGDDRYSAGIRDWVEKGAQSVYVLAPEKLKPKLSVRTADQRLADAEFKLGAYFFEQGDRQRATSHWQEAQKLNPVDWNYHRQDWSFNKKTELTNWFAKVRTLGDKPYYDPVEFPEAATKSPVSAK